MLLQHAALGLRRPPRTRTGAGPNYAGLQQLPRDLGTCHRKRFPLIPADFGCRCTEPGLENRKSSRPSCQGRRTDLPLRKSSWFPASVK